MKTRRFFFTTMIALVSVSATLVTLFLVACNQSQQPIVPAATESKVAASKDVYVVFEGPWAFVPDPKDANSVVALAPKTKSHRELIAQTKENILKSGIYDLSIPAYSGLATSTVDPNILRAKIDPQIVQHVLDSKSERYAIRLPKPAAYVEVTHYRSRADSVYPPDASTEKDYVTAVSLRYNVSTLSGFSLAGSPDSGSFSPLLLRVETPTINFVIEPVRDPDPADKCHTHEREAFRDLTKLVNLSLFLDFPNDPSECHAKDPQNPHPVKADMAPRLPNFFVRNSAGGLRQHLLAAIYFFGMAHDCESPVIVGGG